MYTFFFRIHEREQCAFCHDGYSNEQYTPWRGQKQQQHDDTANMVLQFIIEEISVIMRRRLEMEGKSYPQEEQQLSQLLLPFDFKMQCNQYHMSSKKLKAVPNELIIREGRENTHHSSLIAAKYSTIPARSTFPVSMIDNILPFSPCDLFIFTTTIKICQKRLTNDLIVKVVINYFRQISTEHANYITAFNSLNTWSYLWAIIRTIHVPSPMRLLHLVNK